MLSTDALDWDFLLKLTFLERDGTDVGPSRCNIGGNIVSISGIGVGASFAVFFAFR